MRYYANMRPIKRIGESLEKLGFEAIGDRDGEGFIAFTDGVIELRYVSALYVSPSKEQFIALGSAGEIIATSSSDHLMGSSWYESILEILYVIKESSGYAEYPETEEEEEELRNFKEIGKSLHVANYQQVVDFFILSKTKEKVQAELNSKCSSIQ